MDRENKESLARINQAAVDKFKKKVIKGKEIGRIVQTKDGSKYISGKELEEYKEQTGISRPMTRPVNNIIPKKKSFMEMINWADGKEEW